DRGGAVAARSGADPAASAHDRVPRPRTARPRSARQRGGAAVRAGRAAADRAVKARSALVDSIDAHRDLNAQLTGELEAAQRRLQGTIGQLAAGKPAIVALPLRPFRGVLPWPFPGIVVKRFGLSAGGATTGPRRDGIEISVAEGQPVHT